MIDRNHGFGLGFAKTQKFRFLPKPNFFGIFALLYRYERQIRPLVIQIKPQNSESTICLGAKKIEGILVPL